jgi:hypothetical protein
MKTTADNSPKVSQPPHTVEERHTDALHNRKNRGWFTRLVHLIKGKKGEQLPVSNSDTFLQDHSHLVQTGVRTKATVLDIDDQGKMINFNPIVRLTLRLNDGSQREIAAETIVSLLQLPQIQQQINIAYLPDIPHQVAII